MMLTKLALAAYVTLTAASHAAVNWNDVARDEHSFSLFSPSNGAMTVPATIGLAAMIAAAVYYTLAKRD
jgi:hypothetical protein